MADSAADTTSNALRLSTRIMLEDAGGGAGAAERAAEPAFARAAPCAELAGGAFRCVLGERSTAVCDPVLREGSCSTAWFSLQACARGQVAVGVVRAGYAQLDRWATETGDGWGYLAATGELVHAGRGRKWAGGQRSGQGDSVCLRLDLAAGTLAIGLHGAAPRVCCTGLKGEFCWAAQLFEKGDAVRISASEPAPPRIKPFPARATLAALCQRATGGSSSAQARTAAAEYYVALVESLMESAGMLGPADPLADERVEEAEAVLATEGKALRDAGVVDDICNGRLRSGILRLQALQLMVPGAVAGRSDAAQTLRKALRARRPCVRLGLEDHVAQAALHTMHATVLMEVGGGSASAHADHALRHAAAAAGVAHRTQADRKARSQAADELTFYAGKLGAARLARSCEHMQSHAKCLLDGRLPATPSTTPQRGSVFSRLSPRRRKPATEEAQPEATPTKTPTKTPRRKQRQRSAGRRRSDVRPSPSPAADVETTLSVEFQARDFSERQVQAATLGRAAGVSTYAADAEPEPEPEPEEGAEAAVPWPQRKRAAIVRLQKQLLAARAVIAQHTSRDMAHLFAALEAEAEGPPPLPEEGEEAADVGDADENAEVSREASLEELESADAQRTDEDDQREREQVEMQQRVDRLQAAIDEEEKESAEQQKMLVQLRARAAQAKGRQSSSAGHPTAYAVLEKSLVDQDKKLKKTVALSLALKKQLGEATSSVSALKLSNKRLRQKSSKAAAEVQQLREQQARQLARAEDLQAAAQAEKKDSAEPDSAIRLLEKRLGEAEKALELQSSEEDKILQALSSLTAALDAARASDNARQKQVLALTTQLKTVKLELARAEATNKRERERMVQANQELADSATAHARRAAAAKQQLRKLEEKAAALPARKKDPEPGPGRESLLEVQRQLEILEKQSASQKRSLVLLQEELAARPTTDEVAALQHEVTTQREIGKQNALLQDMMDRTRKELAEEREQAEQRKNNADEARRRLEAATATESRLTQRYQQQQHCLRVAFKQVEQARQAQRESEKAQQAMRASMVAAVNQRAQQEATEAHFAAQSKREQLAAQPRPSTAPDPRMLDGPRVYAKLRTPQPPSDGPTASGLRRSAPAADYIDMSAAVSARGGRGSGISPRRRQLVATVPAVPPDAQPAAISLTGDVFIAMSCSARTPRSGRRGQKGTQRQVKGMRQRDTPRLAGALAEMAAMTSLVTR